PARVAMRRRPAPLPPAASPLPRIAETARAGDNFFVKALSAAYHGTQDHDFFAAVGAGDAIENLASRQRANLPSALDAVLFSDFGIKQTQIVIDLRDGRHGGILAALTQPLFDGDGRGNAGKQIHVRPRPHLEELPRVSGQAVDVTPLSLCVDDVEGQGWFTGAAQTSDERVAMGWKA